MIEVEILFSDEKLCNMSIRGHGIAEGGYGHDIYCAGVSSCLIGALNALNNAENYEISILSGDAKIAVKREQTLHDEIVLETLITQLDTIAKSYPNYVKIVSRKEGSK